MGKYNCQICNKESSQKSHHDVHLLTNDHKQRCEIFRLTMNQKELDEIYKEHHQFKNESNGIAIGDLETQKFDVISKIINYKTNGKMESSPLQKYRPSNNIVWESQNESDFQITKTKENIMKLIKGVHQIFYDQGNTKGTMSDISKILALILLRPLFLDKKSHIWKKVEEVMDMESDGR